MIYKLPIEHKDLLQDIKMKVNNLTPKLNELWTDMFRSCSSNKLLYDDLIEQIQDSNIAPEDINKSILNKIELEHLIPKQENELLHFLGINLASNELEKNLEKIKTITQQGTVNIRPPKSDYSQIKSKKK